MRSLRPRPSLGLVFVALIAFGCGTTETARVAEDDVGQVASEATARAIVQAQAIEAVPSLPDDPACPSGMALVEGDYCPVVEQHCIEWQGGPGDGTGVKGQCKRFKEPTTCAVSYRKAQRYCMDRFEWPNVRGELPRVLVSWQDARALCENAGKRLCTEVEQNFACEGEDMLPYVYGYARDASICSIDKPYRERTFAFTPMPTCLADEACGAAFSAIDQRVPAGSMEACQSKQGIFDLNGNVNEWGMLPDRRSPDRSGIKGGWWGPVRNRCRPTVTFHDEGDYGYEVGFRCCADAAAP